MVQTDEAAAPAEEKPQDEPRGLWTLETGSGIVALEMSTDGSALAIATKDNRVALVSHNGEIKWTREFDRPVAGIDLSSLGNIVVVGLRTGELYCLDDDGGELWSYNIHSRLDDIHISKSGSYVVVGSRDTYTYFFDNTGLLLWRSKADSRIRAIATSTSANYVVSASGAKDIFLHDNYSSNMRGSVSWRHQLGGDITTLAISSDGHYIAAGATDNFFYYFDKLGKLHWKHSVENAITSIALAPRGDFIAVGVEGGTYPGQVCLYSASQGLMWRYLTGSQGVKDVAITTNGRYIIAGTGDGVVSMFHQREKLLWKRKLSAAVNKVRVSARGRYLAVATDDGHLYMFETTEFLLKRHSVSQGLDESQEIVFSKPQRVAPRPRAAVGGAAGAPGGAYEMGRTTVTQQAPPAQAPVITPLQLLKGEFRIPRWGLVLLILIMMVLIGFLTVMSAGPGGEPFLRPAEGVFFIILLAMLMLIAFITKD